MAVDLPPALQERVTCSITAAIQYGIPANVMLAIAERENGKPGLARRNSNATYDLGAMQLNTRYLASLQRYGITPADAMAPGCYPYKLAAWRIRGHIEHDRGDIWTRAANYHSYTPVHNAAYRRFLLVAGAKWTTWLAAHYHVQSSDPKVARQNLSPVTVSSNFGWRWHPVTGGWKAHQGVDLAARQGTPVIATGSGTVVRAGYANGYGNLIAIRHQSGEETRYGHLSRIDVQPGQYVAQGQAIGAVGATGIATGPHLHYEVRVNGTPIDPTPTLMARASDTPRSSMSNVSRHPQPRIASLGLAVNSQGYVERKITAREP